MSAVACRRKKDYVGCFRKRPFITTLILALFAALYFGLPLFFQTSYQALPAAAIETAPVTEPTPPPVTHLQTPKPLKAIYMTACVAGTPSFRSDLVKLIEETELNALPPRGRADSRRRIGR